MERDLTAEEKELLQNLILKGTVLTSEQLITDADRQRWLAKAPHVKVVGQCGCNQCPTIDFTPAGDTQDRIVLDAYDPAQNALIMLFIDDDELSCLEVAPNGLHSVVLPKIGDVRF